MKLTRIQNMIPRGLRNFFGLPKQLHQLKDYLLQEHTKRLQSTHPNPLNRYGRKCFSQTDEDGITLEILRRIDCLEKGVYAEFGVGNGTENNTLILAALGWKGFWVGGERLKVKTNASNNRFAYLEKWITRENIASFAQEGLKRIGENSIDVLSLDLDGNDYYFIEQLLQQGIKPKLFIIEYNAKFPPPVKFKIAYDPQHTWAHDDYYGASLSSFQELFAPFGYELVCCNAHSGCNAFFIERKYMDKFADIPSNIYDIYMEPRYHIYKMYGHRPSIRTVEAVLNPE